MQKRIIIAGNRHYSDYDEAKRFVEKCLKQIGEADTVIVMSGACRGADRLGELMAREKGWKCELYPAEWEKYGKSAGPRRNKVMVELCDAVICFWDGKSKGTASLIRFAKESKKPLFIMKIGT